MRKIMDLYVCNDCQKEFAVTRDNDPEVSPCCESEDTEYLYEVDVQMKK
ncbi:hypothetical protein [Bacillus sp. 03113]|nr:hypothetical protein [Bacillus sp. 03113]